ncbi:unnamed protein product [Symbiodinium sp. CCMP2592]|nr:unnamed protein product [Symbiodinium sp. CCMP2592]
MVRCAMNFGLPQDVDVIPLIPLDIRENEWGDAFKGAAQNDLGELDLDLAFRDELAPPILEYAGCMRKKELNGLYQRHVGRKDLLGHLRPIYEKRLGIARRFCVYFWDPSLTKDEQAGAWEKGWYLGSEIGGGGHTFARCVVKSPPGEEDDNLPPEDGWETADPGGYSWTKDASGFYSPSARSTRMRALDMSESESKEALDRVKLESLRGAVVGQDPEVSKHFCHFFILLALELMAEVQNFRSRWHFRTLQELVKFGLALDSRRVEWRSGARDDRGQPPLPGWPTAGQEEVHFSLGPHATEERSQFKAGEQVLISRGDPLKNRVCEGSVREVDFIGRVMIVSVNGKMPEDPWMVRRYRIDKYANRTTYERQVNALMQFIMMDRTKVCDMLVAAGVGRLDEAVVEEAAIMKRKMERKGMGKGYKGKRQTELAKQDQETKDKTRSSALLNWDAEDFFDDEPDQVTEAPQEEVLAEPEETVEEKECRERTVALAHEEAPGVDPDALELAKSQAMSLPNTSAAQKEAIINSMSKRLTIVQGPPGTGKTHTSTLESSEFCLCLAR